MEPVSSGSDPFASRPSEKSCFDTERAQMREMLDRMEEGVVLYDRDTSGQERVAFFNAQAETSLELPKGMLQIGLARREIVEFCKRRGDHDPGFDADAHLMKTLTGNEVDVLGRRPSGRWILNRSRPRDRNCGSLTLYIDVTDHILASDQLMKSRAEYRTMAETAPIGFLKVDQAGRVVFANSAAFALFGEDQSTMAPFERLIPADGRHFADMIGTGERFEAVLPHGDGTRHILVSVSPWIGGPSSRECMLALTDISALKEARVQIEHMAHHDPLTGLGNRSLFNATWAMLQQTSGGYLETGILMALDLDHFKRVNDEHGHAEGDRLLRAVAGRLQSACGPNGEAFRLGGDEFALIFRDTDAHQATLTAERLVKALSEPFVIGDAILSIGCSVGIASMPKNGLTIEQVQRAADVALYQIKRGGRNGSVWYDHEHERQGTDRRRLEADLAYAISRNELGLRYERRVDLASGETTALEARLRWHNTRLGATIDPATTLALAAATGLSGVIDFWVLSAALADLERFERAGVVCPILAVVFASATLGQATTSAHVRQLLHAHPIAVGRIEIGVFERQVVGGLGAIRPTVAALRHLGVEIAIEGFGGPETSLSSIRSLPVDRVKLDPSLVRSLEHDPFSACAIEAIGHLCEGLAIKVTASEVANERQVVVLRELGVKEAQGAPFGRPQSATIILGAAMGVGGSAAATRTATARSYGTS